MMRVLSVYPKPGAESFLKLASERFEKSKKMRFLDNTVKMDKKKDQHDKGHYQFSILIYIYIYFFYVAFPHRKVIFVELVKER